LVLDARAGGPAARAGVRSTTRDESGRLILGDIIIELAGEQIQDSSDLYRTLDKLSVGETVDVTLLRGVDKVSARVTLDDVKDMKPPTASTIVIPMRTKKSPNSPY
jgi:S1-C subfamily serine protease